MADPFVEESTNRKANAGYQLVTFDGKAVA